VVVEDAVNETAGLKLVELLNPDAEHLPAGFIHLPLVELVLNHEFDDECLLFPRAGPGMAIGLGIGVAVAVCRDGVTVADITSLLADTVSLIRDEAGVLDLLVNALLKRLVKPDAFAGHVVDVGDLGLDAD
jgi:hypothetical protein